MSEKRQKAYKKGVVAEEVAAKYLRAQGYEVLTMRYKTKHGEIDILALKKTMLVAVEVKSRATIEEALYALTPKSRARIQNSLLYFIAENPEYNDHDLRFDLFAYKDANNFQHLDNAWMAEA